MLIKVLNPNVIDQIAAGEVVERPAHLVKELVENAIDAGATEIAIEFSNGGRDVRVEDNGSGISRSDLPLAVARHATSKIANTEDIYRLLTYGFRGEALASIGSVCKLTIESRTANEENGHRIVVDNGKVSATESIGRAVGTTVLVQGLFESVPARLKFLKTAGHESAQIRNTLKAMALCNPKITFRVKADGQWSGIYPAESDFLKRARMILDEPELFYSEYGSPLGQSSEKFQCRVAVSSPHRTVGQSRQIWIFVQGRWVQDRALQAAVMDAYRNLLMHGEYPIAVVSLTCDPSLVDVNVSPNKSQVKFVNSSDAYRAVHHAVRQILESAPWLKELGASPTPAVTPYSEALEFPQPQATLTQSTFFEDQKQSFQTTSFPKRQFVASERSESFNVQSVREAVSQLPEVGFSWKHVAVIGQARLTYILCESDERLILVDQHAAHERILFERLMRGYSGGQLEIQQYLIPLAIQLGEEFVAVLTTHSKDLEKLGLIVEQLGPATLAVNAGPAILTDEAVRLALQKQAEEYVERGGSFHLEKVIGDLMATAACHSAIRAGKPLSLEEMQALLVQMDEFPLSSFCPHGRPVYISWTIREIERDFGRIP